MFRIDRKKTSIIEQTGDFNVLKIECEGQRGVVIMPECQNTRNRDKRRRDDDRECEVPEEK